MTQHETELIEFCKSTGHKYVSNKITRSEKNDGVFSSYTIKKGQTPLLTVRFMLDNLTHSEEINWNSEPGSMISGNDSASDIKHILSDFVEQEDV